MSGLSIFLRQESAAQHQDLISEIHGPVLVLGAAGFIGANALDLLSHSRSDIVGVVRRPGMWRISHLHKAEVISVDIGNVEALRMILATVKPRTVFNFSAYGAYPKQKSISTMTQINIDVVKELGQWCQLNSAVLVHAGSSSEYGSVCSGPSEEAAVHVNSMYGATKLAATSILQAMGLDGLSASVLRLYSVYGPYEEPTRLVPTLIRFGKGKHLPPFSSQRVSRDFLYVTDALEAFWRAALFAKTNIGCSIFNIGSGVATTMSDVAAVAKHLFESDDEPIFMENLRSWDLEQWYANPVKARDVLRWSTVTSFSEGLAGTAQWYLNGREALLKLPQSSTPAEPQRAQHKLSAIIACYKDAEAIPVMYNRLVETFASIGCDYEIIFVNDCSPDDSQAVIQRISAMDPHVIGVLHTRNFGSQSAFISGLRIASGDACVLLDGDLQDPPELIKDFHEKFREGFDVVYGVRVSREATPLLRVFYKAFYRVLARLSSFPVPRDAGDFSLMSRAVVKDLLGFSERELFLRTKRAYIGRRQTGVPYHRPERMFGSSTNSSMRNLQWAIRGIISSSRKPLSVLGIVGASLSALSLLAVLVQVTIRLLRPDLSPPGIVSVVTVTGLFGSLNLLGISIIGEYVGRILEESRGRPRFIQHSVTRGGIERAPEARDESKST